MIQKEYELVSTNEPIMIVKSISEEDTQKPTYSVEYVTKNTIITSRHQKYIFIKQKILGQATPDNLKRLIQNKISIFAFIETLSNKEIPIWINNKLTKPKIPQEINLDELAKFLPDKSIYLKDMPCRSQDGREELAFDLDEE